MSSNKTLPSLQGCRIALTVANDDPASPTAQLLEREAQLLFYPVAQTLPPDSYDELDAALERCRHGDVEWLLIPTPCAAEAISARMAALGILESELAKIRIIGYGAKTRQTIRSIFPTWQFALPNYSSHQLLVEAMELTDSDRVVVPLALRSRTNWHRLLTEHGATVFAPPAYRLILGRGGDDVPGALWGGLVDALVFLTENSVRQFAIRLRIEGGSLDMLGDVVIACLDEQTAAAAKAYGLNVRVIPQDDSFEALADGLAQLFSASAVERQKL